MFLFKQIKTQILLLWVCNFTFENHYSNIVLSLITYSNTLPHHLHPFQNHVKSYIIHVILSLHSRYQMTLRLRCAPLHVIYIYIGKVHCLSITDQYNTVFLQNRMRKTSIVSYKLYLHDKFNLFVRGFFIFTFDNV